MLFSSKLLLSCGLISARALTLYSAGSSPTGGTASELGVLHDGGDEAKRMEEGRFDIDVSSPDHVKFRFCFLCRNE